MCIWMWQQREPAKSKVHLSRWRNQVHSRGSSSNPPSWQAMINAVYMQSSRARYMQWEQVGAGRPQQVVTRLAASHLSRALCVLLLLLPIPSHAPACPATLCSFWMRASPRKKWPSFVFFFFSSSWFFFAFSRSCGYTAIQLLYQTFRIRPRWW